ncbi:ribosomal protein YMR-31 [Sodiomyces alkalinus F11]|uniref:Ribosomal protein YMR-31 n=1 Tax=Sodiomyces alkalinus (strain CBS 110278 / VKM F-3762 / F11) TaxID=1314773 RepID=A0A3N2Q177_SODAK|nr:ribosomal protein YMR-31 [Sodiomyces alkalinus F11]ROT40482.1 ribosomal protein YMR-31 [Sodiomyces alkalinus F11]
MFSTTRALRQAAAHAERTPSIRFIGRRSIPESIDHTPRPHPASPSGQLPEGFGKNGVGFKHANFSSYRQHAQQHGPLQKTIRSSDSIGAASGSQLGAVAAPKGAFFDVSELPARFHRQPIPVAELEAVESGGASLFG